MSVVETRIEPAPKPPGEPARRRDRRGFASGCSFFAVREKPHRSGVRSPDATSAPARQEKARPNAGALVWRIVAKCRYRLFLLPVALMARGGSAEAPCEKVLAGGATEVSTIC